MAREPPTIATALAAPGLERVDARILLEHALGWSHARLIAHSDRPLTRAEYAHFSELADRRRSGEPVAYIVGAREFYGRMFAVNPSVLIPRPETELLVELALERLPAGAASRILDLGTGSGNIAITLALERPSAVVHALDASAAALQLAQENARALSADHIRFFLSAWFELLEHGSYDLIVSNPPYVAEGDPHLAEGDVRFEPRSALIAGPAGLDALRPIIADAPTHLRAGGWLLVEHGYDQAERVGELLRMSGYEETFVAHDLARIARVSGGRRR